MITGNDGDKMYGKMKQKNSKYHFGRKTAGHLNCGGCTWLSRDFCWRTCKLKIETDGEFITELIKLAV